MPWGCTFQWKSRVCWETPKIPRKNLLFHSVCRANKRNCKKRITSYCEVISFHYDNALKMVMCSLADSQGGILFSASFHLKYINKNVSFRCWECIAQIDVTKEKMNSIGYIALATFAHSKVRSLSTTCKVAMKLKTLDQCIYIWAPLEAS